LAEPQAESPSTIYNSDTAGSLLEQSANFQGKVIHSKAHFLITVSRAALAANLAFAAKITLSQTHLASDGFSSKNSIKAVLNTLSTIHLTSGFHNFAFVCHSNCGSTTFTDITAVSPSITSSLVIFWSFSFRISFPLAYLFIVLVRAVLNQVR